MDKEKKGLFGRLLEFWREKLEMGEKDSIGFWNETEIAENHFAEMGAVTSLMQEETKKTFWEETTKAVQDKKEERIFFVEAAESGKSIEEEEAVTHEKRDASKMFTAEVFRNGEWETEETEKRGLGKAFLWEAPEEEKNQRSIIPVAEEAVQKEEVTAEAVQEIRVEEMPKREEKQTETELDIEKLMRQMTKKLWEERESCGRRLR